MSFSGELGKGYLGAFELGAAGAEADLEQSVETVISLVSSASGSAGLEQSVETVISLVSDGSGIRTIPESITSVISFVSDATGIFDLHADATTTISLIDSAQGDVTHPVENTLALTSDATFIVEFFRTASTVISLSSSANFVGPHYEYPATFIDLQSSASFNFSLNVFAYTIIDLDSGAGQAKPASAVSTIVLTSSADHTHATASTVISLVSSATGNRGLESELSLVQIVSNSVIFKRTAITDISEWPTEITNAVSFFIEYPDLECNYHLFVGESTDAGGITPPDITPPTLGQATLTLTYPFVSPTNTLILRNPDFGNKDSLEFNRINRVTRGGKAIIFADPFWPKQQVLSLDISALTETQAQDFLDFIAESLGKEIGLLDHENRQWRGIIMNPDASITDGGKPCTYATSVQFEGELAI